MAEIPETKPGHPDEPMPPDPSIETYAGSSGARGSDDGPRLPAVGDCLGEYEILAPIGSGGMGRVYRARHRRLDREVALKVIAARRIGPEAALRFEREMRAAGRTNHPNIVVATDAGEARGWPYLVMELVSGVDLGRLVERLGPLPVAEACEMARQAALGLQAIEAVGLVHRDIKPANLMLTPDGTVKILDLGLARLVGDSGVGMTLDGSIGGTADYMAPEQALDLHAATAAADLYSLGCTLYCLLAGRPPFGDVDHPSVASKIFAHRGESPPPLSALRPGPTLPAPLVGLLDRLLAKDPAARPSGASEVAEALAPLASGHDLPGLLGADPRSVPRLATRTPTTSRLSEFPKMSDTTQGRPGPSHLAIKILGWASASILGPVCVALILRSLPPMSPPANPPGQGQSSTSSTPPPPVEAMIVEEPVSLFDGKDLSHFRMFLRQSREGGRYLDGTEGDPKGVFTVQDGLLRISGQISGGLETRKSYKDYRLILEYKFGQIRWRQPLPPDPKLLPHQLEPQRRNQYRSNFVVHARGEPQESMTTLQWKFGYLIDLSGRTAGSIHLDPMLGGRLSLSAECSEGELNPVNRNTRRFYYKPGSGRMTFSTGGLFRKGIFPNTNEGGNKELWPNPPGEWNTVECLCAGDELTIFLNGEQVLKAEDLSYSSGQIQIISDGNETFFRRIELLPLPAKKK